MIKTFEIRNFRCFKEFFISDLKRINLIVGKNNVGKTALLEALWLHFGYYNPVLPLTIDNFRGLEKFKSNELLWDLFNGFDPSKEVILISRDMVGRKRTVTIRIHEIVERSKLLSDPKKKLELEALSQRSDYHKMGNSELVIHYLDAYGAQATSRAYIEEDRIKYEQATGVERVEAIFMPTNRKETNEERAERFSRIAKAKHIDTIIETLRIMEDRLDDLQILYVAGDPVLHASLKGVNELIPFPLMGDGIRRLLSIALAISYASGGVVFIDEIENGLHYSYMPKIGNAIAKLASQFDVQIFATSHSDEYIHAISRGVVASPQGEEIGKLFRLQRRNNDIIPVTYTFEELEIAFRNGIEVR